MNLSRRSLCIVTVIALLLWAASATAQPASGYPNRLVRIIVPSPPGGPPDQIARIIANKLQTAFGQSVIVENRAGVGGMKDSAFLADAEKLGIEIDPVSGEKFEALVKHVGATPPAIIEKAVSALKRP